MKRSNTLIALTLCLSLAACDSPVSYVEEAGGAETAARMLTTNAVTKDRFEYAFTMDLPCLGELVDVTGTANAVSHGHSSGNYSKFHAFFRENAHFTGIGQETGDRYNGTQVVLARYDKTASPAELDFELVLMRITKPGSGLVYESVTKVRQASGVGDGASPIVTAEAEECRAV